MFLKSAFLWVSLPLSRAAFKLARRRVEITAIIEITTRSSIKVKPLRAVFNIIYYILIQSFGGRGIVACYCIIANQSSSAGIRYSRVDAISADAVFILRIFQMGIKLIFALGAINLVDVVLPGGEVFGNYFKINRFAVGKFRRSPGTGNTGSGCGVIATGGNLGPRGRGVFAVIAVKKLQGV